MSLLNPFGIFNFLGVEQQLDRLEGRLYNITRRFDIMSSRLEKILAILERNQSLAIELAETKAALAEALADDAADDAAVAEAQAEAEAASTEVTAVTAALDAALARAEAAEADDAAIDEALTGVVLEPAPEAPEDGTEEPV